MICLQRILPFFLYLVFLKNMTQNFLTRICLRLPRAECLFKDEGTEAGSGYKASSARARTSSQGSRVSSVLALEGSVVSYY